MPIPVCREERFQSGDSIIIQGHARPGGLFNGFPQHILEGLFHPALALLVGEDTQGQDEGGGGHEHPADGGEGGDIDDLDQGDARPEEADRRADVGQEGALVGQVGALHGQVIPQDQLFHDNMMKMYL